MRTRLVLTWVLAGLIPDALTAEGPAKIYASGPSGIVRMNWDGSEFEVLTDADRRRPGDLAIDWKERKLYWSDGWKIHRSNYDGSQLESYVDMYGSWLSAHADDLTGFSMDIYSEHRLLLFMASFSYHYDTNQLAFLNIDDGVGSVSDVDLEFDDESNAYSSGAAIVSTDSSRVLMCYALEEFAFPSCYSHEWRLDRDGNRYLWSNGKVRGFDFFEDYHYFVEEGGNHWISRNHYNEDILLVEKQLFSCGFDQATSDGPPQMAMDESRGVMYVNGSSDGRIVGSFCSDTGELGSEEIYLGVQKPPQMVDMAAHDGNLFWSDVQGEIWRWQDDGSEGGSLEKVFAPVVRRPKGLFVDHQAGKILWADPLARTVMQADLDGGNVEVIAEGKGDVHDVLVAEGRLYWSEPGLSTIKSANRDGSDAEEILDLQGSSFQPISTTNR